MSKLKRFVQSDRIFFLTNVTFQRQKLLVSNADLLTGAFNKISHRYRFSLLAWIILDDHFHIIIDPVSNEISRLMHSIKVSFGNSVRIRHGRRTGRIWQNRYWDHMIRSEADMNTHLNYIHYNPVKHGYVDKPFNWPYSSIHKYSDIYQSDWGCREEIEFEEEYGE